MGSHVSIVLPVYNTGCYLDQCVQSILSQTYPDFELLAIDDGSTDDSLDRLRGYAARDKRITLMRQDNQGPGAARNRCLEKAAGRWICFVDGDDYLNRDYLRRLVEVAQIHRADLALCSAVHFDSESGMPLGTLRISNIILPVRFDDMAIEERDSSLKTHLAKTCLAPWAKLYDARLARTLRFPENIRLFEDNPFVYRALAAAERIAYTREPLYYYRARTGSAQGAVRAGGNRAKVLCDYLEVGRIAKQELTADPEFLRICQDTIQATAQDFLARLNQEIAQGSAAAVAAVAAASTPAQREEALNGLLEALRRIKQEFSRDEAARADYEGSVSPAVERGIVLVCDEIRRRAPILMSDSPMVSDFAGVLRLLRFLTEERECHVGRVADAVGAIFAAFLAAARTRGQRQRVVRDLGEAVRRVETEQSPGKALPACFARELSPLVDPHAIRFTRERFRRASRIAGKYARKGAKMVAPYGLLALCRLFRQQRKGYAAN